MGRGNDSAQPGGRSQLTDPHPSKEPDRVSLCIEVCPKAPATTAIVDLSSPQERQTNMERKVRWGHRFKMYMKVCLDR